MQKPVNAYVKENKWDFNENKKVQVQVQLL